MSTETLRDRIDFLEKEWTKAREENAALVKRWVELEAWIKGERINHTGGDRFWFGYEDMHGNIKAKMKELEGGEG